MATEKPRFLITIDADLKKMWEDAAKEKQKSLSKWVIEMVEDNRLRSDSQEVETATEKVKGEHGFYEVPYPKESYGMTYQLEMPVEELVDDMKLVELGKEEVWAHDDKKGDYHIVRGMKDSQPYCGEWISGGKFKKNPIVDVGDITCLTCKAIWWANDGGDREKAKRIAAGLE